MLKLFNKYIVIIVSFYVFWLGILPHFVTKTINMVFQNLSHNSNYVMELSKPKTELSFLPIAKFGFETLTIKSKTDISKIIIDEGEIKVRLLPLISGRVHLNKVNMKNIDLIMSLNENIELDKDFFAKIEKTKVICNSINIGAFNTSFYQKELKSPIKYSGKNFVFQKKNRYIKLKLDSVININDKNTSAKVNFYIPRNNDINKTVFELDISNFDLSPLKAYLKYYLPKDLIDLRGLVNIKANKGELTTEFINCAILYNDVSKSIFFPKKLDLKSIFTISREQINIEKAHFKSKNMDFNVAGIIYDYYSKAKPTVDLNLLVNMSKVEDFINLSPAFRVEELDMYKLKKYKFYGDVLANLTLRGRLPEPDINGDIYITNGILIKPIPNAEQGATIKLKLTGKNVFFDVQVPAGNSQKVWVEGSQEIYNVKYANLFVKSTDSVDLKTAQDVVNPLHEILNFIVGPLPIMDVSGKGNIDIIVKGNRKIPHVWGDLVFKNARVRFRDLPDLVLVDADALLSFNDDSANFANNTGQVNGKNFKVIGSCNLSGKFDFDVLSQDQSTLGLYNAISSSKFIPELSNKLPKIDKITGLTDLNLKVYGAVKYIEDLAFNKNIFAKGEIVFKNNEITLGGVEANNTNGIVKFDATTVDAKIDGKVAASPMSMKAKVKNNIADILLEIPKINPNSLLKDVKIKNLNILPLVSVSAKYKGGINVIDYNKLKMDVSILDSMPNSNIKFISGLVSFLGNRINISNLKGYIESSENIFQADLQIDNAFVAKPEVSGSLKVKTPDIKVLNSLLAADIYPVDIDKILKNIEFNSGALDTDFKISNNKVYSDINLEGIIFTYLPIELPVEIMNGKLLFRNNLIKFNKINILADKMPILLDGDIKDVFDKQNFNLYISSKPIQDFIDKYINKNQVYPIKIKGDIVYWAKLRGVPDNFDIKAKIDMSKESSFYHFGATVGDVENAISVSIDSKILDKNLHRIREFSYDKIIDSQSGRQTSLNMLKASGAVKILPEDLAFNDLSIKTTHPTDARIFNIIFRKPNIKQGQFTSDLKINGKLSDAKVLGDFHIFETNIPFLDTTMKNIELVFKDKTIDFNSKGEIIGNDITFSGIMKNKLTVPYRIEKASLYTKDLNLNQIVEKLKLAEVENLSTFESFEGFDINSIVANNFKLKADNVQLRNIHATDFDATISLSDDGILNANKFRFNIANGILSGNYKYNIKNQDMSLNLTANDIDANDVTWALFDLNNQIYGDLTGEVSLTCDGSDFNQCMQTLSGSTTFNVSEGRMPKLGSLEYLLKAGNLVKGGLTGLSINSVIDLITPLKTGEFSDINGAIRIKDGIARNVEITSKGKDLSLFIGGTYNFATSIADMQVYGLLSRKISNILGPIGNMSINTLFNVIPGVDLTKEGALLEKINKIPGIELSSKAYRKFIADIKGNINGDDYVTSFKWIN